MADAVTSQTIADGERNAVMKFTNVSDGTGESAVVKVDVSALASNNRGVACSEGRIMQVRFALVGMSVQLFFDATANVLAFELAESSNGNLELRSKFQNRLEPMNPMYKQHKHSCHLPKSNDIQYHLE